MSNASSFDLVVRGADLDELRVAYRLLQAAPGEWELLPIEHGLFPAGGYRFRARIWSDEEAAGKVVTGPEGIVADLLEAFSDLEVSARFRDEIGSGTLDGYDKEYEYEYDLDEEEEGQPLDEPAAPLIVWSDTALAAEAEPFAATLEAIGVLLHRSLEAAAVGCTLVEDETTTWSVSGTVAALAAEQIQQLCRELRRLRVPLDTCLERGARRLPVWPVSQRDWRRMF